MCKSALFISGIYFKRGKNTHPFNLQKPLYLCGGGFLFSVGSHRRVVSSRSAFHSSVGDLTRNTIFLMATMHKTEAVCPFTHWTGGLY